MLPWEVLDIVKVPDGGGKLRLVRRGTEYAIRANGYELMNSRMHGSEDALAELTCERLSTKTPRILIGGLGMGFTVRAALDVLGPKADVVVAELVPAVETWNRGPLAHLANSPLDDPRVTVQCGDIANILKGEKNAYDAILLDVDNGPEGLTRDDNNWLYTKAGLRAAMGCLTAKGIFSVWSAARDKEFKRRLKQVGFDAEEIMARSRGRRSRRHIIWVATKGD